MDKYLYIFSLIILTSGFYPECLGQNTPELFPELDIAYANKIVSDSRIQIELLPDGIKTHFLLKKSAVLNKFKPIPPNLEVPFLAEDIVIGVKEVDFYLISLIREYKEIDLTYTIIDNKKDACTQIFHYQLDPNIGLIFTKVIRELKVTYLNNKNLHNTFIDTVIFTTQFNIKNPLNSDNKIAKVSRNNDLKTARPVLCIEDEQEGVWLKAIESGTAEGFKKYLDYCRANSQLTCRHARNASNYRTLLNTATRSLKSIKNQLRTLSNPAKEIKDFIDNYTSNGLSIDGIGKEIIREAINIQNRLNDDFEAYEKLPILQEEKPDNYLRAIQKHKEDFGLYCMHISEIENTQQKFKPKPPEQDTTTKKNFDDYLEKIVLPLKPFELVVSGQWPFYLMDNQTVYPGEINLKNYSVGLRYFLIPFKRKPGIAIFPEVVHSNRNFPILAKIWAPTDSYSAIYETLEDVRYQTMDVSFNIAFTDTGRFCFSLGIGRQYRFGHSSYNLVNQETYIGTPYSSKEFKNIFKKNPVQENERMNPYGNFFVVGFGANNRSNSFQWRLVAKGDLSNFFNVHYTSSSSISGTHSLPLENRFLSVYYIGLDFGLRPSY